MKIDLTYQNLKVQAQNLMTSGDVSAYIQTLFKLQEMRKNFPTASVV